MIGWRNLGELIMKFPSKIANSIAIISIVNFKCKTDMPGDYCESLLRSDHFGVSFFHRELTVLSDLGIMFV